MNNQANNQPRKTSRFIVGGKVRFADGVPAPQTKVVAFDRDLRREQPLGEAQTDRNGAYCIEYSEKNFFNQERGSADLVVKALDAKGSVLIVSETMFNAPQEAQIDLTITLERMEPPSLFERIGSALKPLLCRVQVEELEEDQEHQDLTFLSGETGFDKRDLARFVLAHYLARLGIDREFWFALLGGSFFEYVEKESMKENLARTQQALPALDARAVRKALTGSFTRREIPDRLRGRTDEWIEAFLGLVVRLVLGDAKSPTFVRLALDHAGINDADKHAKFARMFIDHKALTPELLDALEKDRSFKKAEIADLRTSYQLAELTQGDFSVVKMLKEDFNIRRPEQIRSLAKRSEGEWVELIESKHKKGEIKLPLGLSDPDLPLRPPEAEIYAKTLERRFREAFATAAFAGGMERGLENGGVRGIRHAKALGRIIECHPEFDLLRTPVDEFLKNGLRAEFRAQAKDETFRLELKAVQRVFKLVPMFDATDALLADGLHSAQMVYRLGESEFVRRYANRPGFSADRARQAWNRAADTHAAVLTVIGDLAAFDSGILPGVLKSSHPDLKKFPNWQNLFKTGDICHCEHCSSVLSPAAYFTDLLMFLRDRNSTRPKAGGFHSVKKILFDRRPDLGYIELNCENALTTLPYVDVVCEVLEYVVAAGKNDVELAGFNVMPAGSAAAKAAVAAALSAKKISIGNEFTLSQVDPADPDRWVVHGDQATYLLKKKATPNFFAELLPNTKLSSEELRAYPAHVNPEAYIELRKARFPHRLPFDLYAEEVRAAFQKSNLQRWDLMRTFRGPAAPNNPTEGEIAAEYFGISCDANAPFDEKRLILLKDPTVAGQQAVWGETGNGGWLDLFNAATGKVVENSLANVKYFLNKTGLDYNELEALLDLAFINPDNDIEIQHLDASCDTDKKVIQGLNTAKLDRIHRFLRLWRKLTGWKMWELDRVIRCEGVGQRSPAGEWLLDEAFLINLFYFSRLKTRLGAKSTVEQLCGLFDDLNIETPFVKSHEKRADGLYQSLFLNRKLIQPIDPAFAIDPATRDIVLAFDPNTGQPVLDPVTGAQVPSKIGDHHTTFLAAIGIRETDLVLLKSLKKPIDGTAYITDDLTLENLSFLWRHAWLAKQLKFKAEEWRTLLKLFQQNIMRQVVPGTWVPSFADPKFAFEFVEKVDHLKATGFTPDELNWLLAADPLAKAALKETDTARFLAALRKDLQAIREEYKPEQYAFLSPPRDVANLDTLLASILQKLNRDETEGDAFLKTLRGPVLLEADVQGLGAVFNFPLNITGVPHHMPISHVRVLRFNGLMTQDQRNTMLTAPSLGLVTVLPSYQQAIQDLFKQSGQATAPGMPAGFTFPADITGPPNNIPIRYESVLRFRGVMTEAQRTVLLGGALPAAVTGNIAYVNAIEDLFRQSATARDNFVSVEIEPAAPGLTLPADQPSIPIRYDSDSKKLIFLGVMTNAERMALQAAGNPAAQIDELSRLPRLAVKFFEPIFTAPLDELPSAIDFKAKLLPDLASKISYDVEQRLLRFAGIMRESEQLALNALVPNLLPSEIAYHIAVNSLYAQPTTIAPPDEGIWLTDSEIDPMLPANNTLAKRLATAAQNGLAYLSRTFSANRVVEQSSAQLGLTQALTLRLLTHYALFPETLLAHLTESFATSSKVVDYLSHKSAFDGWYWINRVAAILKKWQITLADLDKLIALAVSAQLLDFSMLPLDETGNIPDIDVFLSTNRLVRFRDRLPETKITLLEVLEKLSGAKYATSADFAGDVQRLNEAWSDTDVEVLVASLDLAYPNEYLLAESWERIRRAFYFIEKLNAKAEEVKAFAAVSMTDAHAKILKNLLCSKFGSDTWLILSAEIQDALRERKRDALAAYLLTQPRPDAPTGKWENTNDLYAYHLLDVEMSSCQLTSRLVQASGSVQLFVQRCFMGLEPEVKVQADGPDGDSAWRWWDWMRKYRIWEANRKVFLWPENWIEPELKKDRSLFFKDLENELVQNEINQYTVESAFANYLEKLAGVAQLEIAGFYQEDDGDNTIIHVFGRTKGAEPHIYYYRRYDYRQWTPWEKVELDIQGDYLVPAVLNKRLFLFWPVFTEALDEEGNSTVNMPQSDATTHTPDKTKKKLRLQMAVSDYRQGKWTPKRQSKDYDESETYEVEIIRRRYRFFPVDRTEIDGRFVVEYHGSSMYLDKNNIEQKAVEQQAAKLSGAFEISGCSGVPERVKSLFDDDDVQHAIRPEKASTGNEPGFLKWEELSPREHGENDFALENYSASQHLTLVLIQTPSLFKVSPPWHLSYLDRLYYDGTQIFERHIIPIGSWLPFFYNDQKRTFFVLPSLLSVHPSSVLQDGGPFRSYYPGIKEVFRELDDFFVGLIRNWVDNQGLPAPGTGDRQDLDELLDRQFPGEVVPPFEDSEILDRMTRYWTRYVRFWMGRFALQLFQNSANDNLFRQLFFGQYLFYRQFHFLNFYHPFVCDFAKLIHNPLQGVPGLMKRETQLMKNSGFSFKRIYQPHWPWVVDPSSEDPKLPEWAVRPGYPREVVDFSPDGAYSCYNWELFFHAPLFIANALSKNQRFEEARDWYHYIFNPIGVESTMPGSTEMSKYWITKPFFETTRQLYVDQRIDNILRLLSEKTNDELEGQVLDWRTNPFEPHRIANYRTVAYQKTVVMKYLDNLIAWGDYLFRQDSMESINEATQIYILAAEILGPRPKKIPPQAKPSVESFNELETQLDAFANALVEVENLIPIQSGYGQQGATTAPLPMLYFCIPHNDKMLAYWDTVADRLYKIRHCMNIEGVVRQLALFEPPIDPGALVKAVAAGLDIGAALADFNAPLPFYRFNVLLQKANEVCNDVKALGAALLSALEKKDAEALSLLRQGQELRVLEAVKALREKQIEEADESLLAVKKSKELAEIKKTYYESREFMNAEETAAMVCSFISTEIDTGIATGYILASIIALIAQISGGGAGAGGSPVATAETGGQEMGESEQLYLRTLEVTSQALTKIASTVNTMASYYRRQDDWDFQEDLAVKEIGQLEKSIAAAELRVAIATKELENHVMQIENAKAIDNFMHSKYTNEELYQWQVGQISGVYFQSYKLAYDLAKRAERCYRYELGLQDSSFISFGYWDSLKKGLLSGEKLQFDLRRLESTYLEQNRREFEITKHVSLAQLDPLALVRLRETGRCFFYIPEELFDLDYPGHYFRRIKSVSLTLPCVTGPYTTISCTLRLLKNSIRINTTNGDDNGYPRNTDDAGLPSDDTRFLENNIPFKAIAASSAQNDSGIFELNFRDERYLPFEGAGVISEWSLELFSDLPANNPDPAHPDFGRALRQFDYGSISDAVLHIKYTAREDVGIFKNAAITHLRDYFSEDGATPLLLALNLRRDFPTQWSRFIKSTNPANGNIFEFDVSHDLFPIRDAGKSLKVNTIVLLARCTDSDSYAVTLTPPLPPLPDNANTMTLERSNTFGGLHFDQKDVSASAVAIVPTAQPETWRIEVKSPSGVNLGEVEIEDFIVILGYEWK
jgi:hypothetical protein